MDYWCLLYSEGYCKGVEKLIDAMAFRQIIMIY